MDEPLLEWSISAASGLILIAKATLLLGVAWLLSRLRWCGSAAIRHGTWSVALVAALGLPFAGLWIPSISVGIPGLRAPENAEVGAAAPGSEGPGRGTPPSGAAEITVYSPETDRQGQTGARGATLLKALASLNWNAILVFVWIAGAVARCLWLGALFFRTRLLIGRAVPPVDPGYQLTSDRLAKSLGIRRRVRLLVSHRASMPLASGLASPVVVLPAGMGEWTSERLEAVLLHELAHVRRWDFLTSLIADLACALYWPLPLAWLARRSVRIEQEQACDDRVLKMGVEAVDYAEHLLAVARAFYSRRWDLGLAVTMAREVNLKTRVRAILDSAVDRRPFWSATGIAANLILVALFFPIAALEAEARTTESEASDGHLRLEDAFEFVRPLEALIVGRADALTGPELWLEAEAGEIGGDLMVREDLDASRVAYLGTREGPGQAAPGSEGEVRFTINLPVSGDYFLWARLSGDDDDHAAIQVTFDDGIAANWELAHRADLSGWHWSPVTGSGSDAGPVPVRFNLGAGQHSLRVRPVDPGVRIDRLLLTGSPTFQPTGQGGPALALSAAYHVLEAEHAGLSGRLDAHVDDRASSGEYLVFRSDEGTEGEGAAVFVFDIREAGRYLIWGRVSTPDAGSHSFFASLDGSEEVIWDIPARVQPRATTWTWNPLSARDATNRTIDPLAYDLQPGHHVLKLRTREEGVRLDAILVTNDLTHRPRGIWPESLPARPIQILLEAESGILSGPLAVRTDPAAGGSRAVRVDSDRDAALAGEAGLARLRFTAPDAGLYTIWARTSVGDGDGDSFWVRINGGAWIRWNGIPRSGGWSWSAVHDADHENQLAQFQLDSGNHLLEIAGREGGAMLDQLLITNDPRFQP